MGARPISWKPREARKASEMGWGGGVLTAQAMLEWLLLRARRAWVAERRGWICGGIGVGSLAEREEEKQGILPQRSERYSPRPTPTTTRAKKAHSEVQGIPDSRVSWVAVKFAEMP